MRARSLVSTAIISTTVLLGGWVATARADDAGKTAKVEEFFRAAKLDEVLKLGLEQTTQQLNAGMLQHLTGATLTPEETRQVNEFNAKVAVIVTDGFSWDKVKPAYVKLFAESYTDEELDGLIAFYKSPTGQAMVTKMPVVMAKASQIAQQQMTAITPALRALLDDFKAKAAKDAPAKTPK